MSQIRRREFLISAGALLAAPLARAQQSARSPVLGALYLGRKPTPQELAKRPLFLKLKSLGWVEGQNLVVENAYAEGREDRMPALAAALVAKKVDVIWALGPEAAIAAARATSTIPIVFWGVPFPVEQGLIKSFARPGGNVTGIAALAGGSAEILTKRLQLLKEIAPGITRIARISSPTSVQTVSQGRVDIAEKYIAIVESVARSLKLEVQTHRVFKVEDFDAVFAAIVASKAEGLDVVGSPLTAIERPRIVDFANRNRLVSSMFDRAWVQAGGLFSYGFDAVATIGQTAACIDKILRGARPSDIPVEIPSKWLLIINLKTAKAIGITIPQSVLARAHEVIE